jgi:hypothetical protein
MLARDAASCTHIDVVALTHNLEEYLTQDDSNGHQTAASTRTSAYDLENWAKSTKSGRSRRPMATRATAGVRCGAMKEHEAHQLKSLEQATAGSSGS